MAIYLNLIDKLPADYKKPEDIIGENRATEATHRDALGAAYAGRNDPTPWL
jgi:hypothetical protein